MTSQQYRAAAESPSGDTAASPSRTDAKEAGGERRSRRGRTVLIVALVLALLVAIAVPIGFDQVRRAEAADAARTDAALIVASLGDAEVARAALVEAVTGSAAFATEVVAPAVEAAGDGARFSEESIAAITASHAAIIALSEEQPEAVALDERWGAPDVLEQRLIDVYIAADDLEIERAAVAEEASRLEGLQRADGRSVETAETALAAAIDSLRSAAEVGSTNGDAALAEHDRASDESRGALSGAVEVLTVLAAALSDREESAFAIAAELRAAEVLPADAFSSYRGSAAAVQQSHTEVVEAEAAAAAEAARQEAARQEAARQAAAQNGSSGGGSSGGGSSGGGGGVRMCTYVGFGGTVNIKPCR